MTLKIYIKNYSQDTNFFKKLVKKWNLVHDKNSQIHLIIHVNNLELIHNDYLHLGSLKINFSSRKNIYRYKSLNKKNEILSKVIGIKKNYFPYVLDATAGLGQDGFILASLGCKVTLIERNPFIAIILDDAIRRIFLNLRKKCYFKFNMKLLYLSSFNMLNLGIIKPDVIYLDPMFPYRKIKSLPQKNIQLLQKIVGYDCDSHKLLNISRKLAKRRIVVKRFLNSPFLYDSKPNWTVFSKNHRFDIYLPF